MVATSDVLAVTLDPLLGTCSVAPLGRHPQGLIRITNGGIELLVDCVVVTGFRATSQDAVEEFADSASLHHQLRFQVPALVSGPAPIADVLRLAYARFGDHGTPDVVFSRIARALAASGDLDGAIDAASWSLAAGHRTGHLLLGGVLLAAARPVDAYDHIRTHLAFVPTDWLGWLALGRACEARGDQPEARRAYARVLIGADRATDEAALAREALDRLPARALWDEPWR